jgi:serine/threonine-protein kinase
VGLAAGAGQATQTTPGRATTTDTPVTTPREAMHLDEIRRTRVFATFIVVFPFCVGVAVLLMGGDPWAKRIHLLGIVLAILFAAWVLWVIRDGARYRPWHSMLIGYGGVIGVNTAYYYWGVFSAALLVIPIGAYFFALGQSFAVGLSILLVCIVPHLALTVLVIFGVVDDVGRVRAFDMSALEQAGMLSLLQFCFVAAFVMARGIRKSTLDAIEQLDQAVRGIAQREALLHEAKQELDRALRIGGPGRYTTQTVGSFTLGNLLGRGAMGEVYEASHVATGQLAAVKVLTVVAQSDPSQVVRFFREAEIVARLRVANVVRVFETSGRDAPIPFIAMERLNGDNLADILRDRPRMSVAAVVAMMRDLAAGVQAAHDAGIVHRDLKPRNLVCHAPAGGAPIWKILDFGVSKLGNHGGTLTQGKVIGTPAFMAPEQARGGEVDHRADLHALGVIAYRALTGRPAFAGSDVPSILYQVAHELPPRPSEVAPVPPALDAVLTVALAKDPAQRFAAAARLAEAFERAATGVVDADLETAAARLAGKHPWSRVA